MKRELSMGSSYMDEGKIICRTKVPRHGQVVVRGKGRSAIIVLESAREILVAQSLNQDENAVQARHKQGRNIATVELSIYD